MCKKPIPSALLWVGSSLLYLYFNNINLKKQIMKKSMFTLVFAFLAFAFITSCGSKSSESIEVGVEVEDSTVVDEPAVLEEGVEVSEDAPVVE